MWGMSEDTAIRLLGVLLALGPMVFVICLVLVLAVYFLVIRPIMERRCERRFWSGTDEGESE